ncbi:hypothetical protein PV04_08872 [Phialophora macrospora]|uniref:RING-type domain-containing protein n=1 Tax=Phialophora macrospora TaxID=1851006 RepID=A0A0D2CFJ9_9EURO|nr:hypothetical protein PV04_08872 [Phialophora macrospora]
MDQYLRCNNGVNGRICRAELRKEAVVTTCAHIFCIHCADSTGLTGAPQEHRRCPTCESELPHPYDVVRNLLRPPDDYKTSVLAGLDPATIVECIQKALNFWTFQNTQEHAYQQCKAKLLEQRCQQLMTKANEVVRDANARIEALDAQKYADLFRQYQEKSKKQQQTQKLYNAIKQKVQVEKMGAVANNDVDHTLHSINVIGPLDKMQHDQESRQGFRATEPRNTVERVVPRYGVVHGQLERLHPHQRSGSSVAGSQGDHMGMPPPGGPRASGIPNPVTSGTPLHRATLPAITRLSVNRSQIPHSVSRNEFPAGQPLPGSACRQQNQANKMRGFAENRSALRFGMNFGRTGTAGSLDENQNYGGCADKTIHSARHSLDLTGTMDPLRQSK